MSSASCKRLDKTDPKLPSPVIYPGKRNRNNKGGTLLTKQEWMKGEVNKWVTRMKEDINYNETIHSRKALLLNNWMRKTFNSISMKNVKQLLYDCESD